MTTTLPSPQTSTTASTATGAPALPTPALHSAGYKDFMVRLPPQTVQDALASPHRSDQVATLSRTIEQLLDGLIAGDIRI